MYSPLGEKGSDRACSRERVYLLSLICSRQGEEAELRLALRKAKEETDTVRREFDQRIQDIKARGRAVAVIVDRTVPSSHRV